MTGMTDEERLAACRTTDIHPWEEMPPAVLGCGDALSFTVRGDDIEIARTGAAGTPARITQPYPGLGLWGGRMVVSPLERFLVVLYCSGQGDESFYLCDLSEGVRLVAAPDYAIGYMSSVAFSSDETTMLVARLANCPWDEWPEEVENQVGPVVTPFATLTRCDCATGNTASWNVDLAIQEPHTLPRNQSQFFDYDLDPKFESADLVRLALPWSKEVVMLSHGASALTLYYPPSVS